MAEEEEPTAKHCDTIKAVREYTTLEVKRLETKIDERDDRYEQRFVAQEKAIGKAETSQEKYNEEHNSLSRRMIPREEHEKELKAIDDKFCTEIKNLKERADDNREEILNLKEYKSKETGKTETETTDRQRQQWIIMAVVGGISILIAGCGLVTTIFINVVLKLWLGY